RAANELVLRHDGPVMSAVFLADGRVATADVKKQVRIWDANGNSVLLPVQGAFLRAHPTAKWLVVKNDLMAHGVTAVVWDLDHNETRLKLLSRGWLDFNSDGTMLAVSDREIVRIWDTKTWQPVNELKEHKDLVVAGVFSKDGRTLYTGSMDRVITVWNLPKGEVKARGTRDQRAVGLQLPADDKVLIELMSTRIAYTNPTTGEPLLLPESAASHPVLLPTAEKSLYATTTPDGEI